MTKQEYEHKTTKGNYSIEIDFNYYFACYVYITDKSNDYSLCWSQYENCICSPVKGSDEVKSHYLTRQTNLIPDIEEVKQALQLLQVPSQFPVDLFIENIQNISEDIRNNYDQYWSEFRATCSANK